MKNFSVLLMSLITCNLAFADHEEAALSALGILLLIHLIIVFLDYKFNGKSILGTILLFLLFFIGAYALLELSSKDYFSSQLSDKYMLLIVIMFFYIGPFLIKTLFMKMYQLRKGKR